jgi:hypothetical protein
MPQITSWPGKARSFFRQPLFVQLWFPPVWVLLGISKVLIFTIPFQRLAPQLGVLTGIEPWVPQLTLKETHRARLIGRVVQMTARYTFWNANCFPQAITARWLLGLYDVPYVFFFGLSRDANDPDGMKAHAWVAAGPVRVTGGYSFHQFTVVGTFADAGLARSLSL